MGRRGRGSCQGCIFAGTFGLLLRQASLGVNFCAPLAAESKPQKFPYAPLKHNLATRAGKLAGIENDTRRMKIINVKLFVILFACLVFSGTALASNRSEE